jgi:hypothetical protein
MRRDMLVCCRVRMVPGVNWSKAKLIHVLCANSRTELVRIYTFDPGANWPVGGNPLAMRSRMILDIVADNIKENGEGMISKN